MARCVLDSSDCSDTTFGMRGDANGLAGLCIDKSRGSFAVVHQVKRAVTKRTTRSHGQAVREAPVCFDKCQHTFAGLRHVHLEQRRAKQAHTQPQDLAWTDMIV